MEFYTSEMRAAERLDTENDMHEHFEKSYVTQNENSPDVKKNINIPKVFKN